MSDVSTSLAQPRGAISTTDRVTSTCWWTSTRCRLPIGPTRISVSSPRSKHFWGAPSISSKSAPFEIPTFAEASKPRANSCMPRDPRAWLLDVITACELLSDFTRGKTFEDYAADVLLRSAVERQLEIIGEALRVAVHHRPE